jgi:hypothetical protein
MATRINVTAVRDCGQAELRAVMSQVLGLPRAGSECGLAGDQLEICEHGGWAWFITSVWGASAIDLNRGLCKLARPALQFTTSDGDRWYLSVHGGPHGQVRFVHEFSYHSNAPDPAEDARRQAQLELSGREEPPPVDPRLVFLESEHPAGAREARPSCPFDLAADALNELGAVIPDEFREAVAHLPFSAAVNRYRQWHAEQVTTALADARIPHRPAAVCSVLLWESVTENERDSDLGNLPRLLSVLGLGAQWDAWVLQAESGPTPPEAEQEPAAELGSRPGLHADAGPLADGPREGAPADGSAGQHGLGTHDESFATSTPAREDRFAPVLAIVEHLVLLPVAGGPFALPLNDLALTRFFVEALSIHDTAGVVMHVTLPPGLNRSWIAAPPADRAGAGTVELTADGFRFGVDNHLWFSRGDLPSELGEGLAQLLYHLPDGSAIDLAFAHAQRPALTQRYRGPVSRGAWQISETYPQLARDALADAAELARYAESEHEEHILRDEAEAEAVVKLAKQDPNLWDMRVQREGRTVWCDSDIVGHLPKVVFRNRFAAFWNIAAHDREAAKLYEQHREMQQKLRRAGAEAARRRAAPHDDAVLFRGKLGPYWRSEFARLEELEQETRERIDGALVSLGMRHVGDLVAKQQRDILLRTHLSADCLSYGFLMAKRTMYLGYEFFSRFKDGSHLTTTNRAMESRPELKVYAKIQPGLEPAALYDKHRWGIERFRTRKGTEPVPLEPTLLAVARELDRALARREGISLRIRIVSPPAGEPPANIRAAWVGCILPLHSTTDDLKASQSQKGALSRERVDPRQGFVVRATDALGELERHNPSAARWWRDNAPHVFKPGQLFVFEEDACELVEEVETPRHGSVDDR